MEQRTDLHLWLHNTGRVQLRNQHSSKNKANIIPFIFLLIHLMPIPRLNNSRQSGCRSPDKQILKMPPSIPFRSIPFPQGAPVLLGSGVGVSGSQPFSPGDWLTWLPLKTRGSKGPGECLLSCPRASPALLYFLRASEIKSS